MGCGSIPHDVTNLACVAVRYIGLESWEQQCGTGDDILDLVTERGDVRLYHEALLVDVASQGHGGELSARFRSPLGTLDLVFGGVRDRVLWPAPEMAAPPGGSGSGIDPALLEFVSVLAQRCATDGGRRDLILGTTLFSVRFSTDVLRVDWVDDDVDGVRTDHRALGLAEPGPLNGTEGAAQRGPQGTGAQRRLTHSELVDLAAGAVIDQARLTTSGTLTLSLRTGDGAHTVSFLGVDEMTVSGGAEVCGVGEVWVPLDGPGPRRLVVGRCSRETEVSRAGGSIRVVLDEADGVAVSFRCREVWSGKRAVRETGDLSPSR